MSGTDVARRPASAYDEIGAVAFVEAHKTLPAGAEALAAEYQAMATAAETQPVAQSVKENLQALANAQKRVAEIAASLYAPARQAQAQDYDKVENPRGGSVNIEKKGDASQTQADGFA